MKICAFVALIMALSGCTTYCHKPENRNKFACAVVNNTVDCTKDTLTSDGMMAVVKLLIEKVTLADGSPDWGTILAAVEKLGIQDGGCIIAGIEKDLAKPSPAVALENSPRALPVDAEAAATRKAAALKGLTEARKKQFPNVKFKFSDGEVN